MAPDDLAGVAAWLKCSTQAVSIRRAKVAMSVFANQVESCLASYPSFRADEERMFRILRQLQQGAAPFPVFVEEGDDSMFILEGRHRVVAFHQFGLSEVDVAFVSKAE